MILNAIQDEGNRLVRLAASGDVRGSVYDQCYRPFEVFERRCAVAQLPRIGGDGRGVRDLGYVELLFGYSSLIAPYNVIRDHGRRRS